MPDYPQPESPLPGVDLKKEVLAHDILLDQALTFSHRWISQKQGSAAEFLGALIAELGSRVKIVLNDLTSQLSVDGTLTRIQREYVETVLSLSEIQAVLDEKSPSLPLWENTLDELFNRSLTLRSSEKFVEAITFVSKLREYAPYNNMLVYLQRPAATFWATAPHWRKEFHRRVKAEAIPIIMLQPRGPVMLVYDVLDTEGPPLPARFTNAFQVQGELEPSVLDKTFQNCARAGIGVGERKLSSLHAGTAIRWPSKEKAIVFIELNDSLDKKAQYATLCHELGHIYLGHLGGHPDGAWPSRMGLNRSQRELEAEAVAYMVCFRANLTTQSAEYLAGYLTNQTTTKGVSIDLVMRVAGLIERMGRSILPIRKGKKHKESASPTLYQQL